MSPGRAPAHALVDISFQLQRGEVMGLVGESGCGKSTLALALMRLLPSAGRITQGAIRLQGTDLLGLSEREMADYRWQRIAMVFQGAMNALNPVRTVGDQIAEAIRQHATLPGDQVDGRVSELLDLVGIAANRKSQYPFQYSGGMRQRAMIAMALACNPDIIIADEPTTALDVMIQAQILDLLANLQRQLGLAIILVTHDLGIVAELCDRVLVMYGGVTAEQADVDTVFNAPQHPYTQELLKAFPDPSRLQTKLASIPGTPPRLDALPPGCRFAPRCPAAFDRCSREAPPLYPLSGQTRGAAVSLWNRRRPEMPYPAGAMQTEPILAVRDLRTLFPIAQPGLWHALRRTPTGYVRAVDGVSFDLMPKEALAVVGESGCGKSTLALTLMGLERPTSGSIRFEGQELSGADGTLLKAARRQMQMVFQDPYESLNPLMHVGEIVGEPLHVHGLARDTCRTQRACAQCAGGRWPTTSRHLPQPAAARALRWAAPARGGGGGARPGTKGTAGGRAGVDAGRQHPCRNLEPACRTQAGARHLDPLYHARSWAPLRP